MAESAFDNLTSSKLAELADERGLGLVYVACPYSHPDAEKREARFELANDAAAFLMSSGLKVFSPISHSHVVARNNNLPTSWEFWKRQDLEILKHAKGLVVVTADGWETSVGVQAEINEAKRMGIEILYLPPEIIVSYSMFKWEMN